MKQPEAIARLERQIRFIVEIDKLKSIYRRTYVIDERRRETTAEHSWHLALMAMLLAEHSNQPIDLMHVMKMVLIHDIVEIDAGDTFAYDTTAAADKQDRERAAADRLFRLLPEDQEKEFRALWDEFEQRQTPEAQFATTLDRLIPQIHNYYGEGGSWKEHRIVYDQVVAKNSTIRDGSTRLWDWTVELLNDAVSRGFLEKNS